MANFRAAIVSDIPALTALWHQGWHEAHATIVPAKLTALRTQSSFADRILDHLAECRLGFVSGELAGFHMTSGAELYQFYVASNARGSGFAKALVADAEMTLRATGHHHVWLACSIGNDRAAAFYRKSGWTNVGTKRIDLESSMGAFPLDIWRFEKSL